ncbi:MAG: hypothetical protein QW484_03650 [Candidatus Pacearchaeota archaeon]
MKDLIEKIISEIPKDVISLEIAKARSEQDILSDVIVLGIYINGITKQGKNFELEYWQEFKPKNFFAELLDLYDYQKIELVAKNIKEYFENKGIKVNIRNLTF